MIPLVIPRKSRNGRKPMLLRQHLMLSAMVLASVAQPASAAPWVRGYVVGAYEYAFRYGGRADFCRGAEIEPGVDCPHGSTVHFADPDQAQATLARRPGARSRRSMLAVRRRLA